MNATAPRPDYETIQSELRQAHARDQEPLQFGSLISARQYLPAYRLVARHVPAGGRVLDWGAGNGHFSYFLLRSGYQTAGFDFREPFALLAPWFPGVYDYRRVDPANPTTLPFPAEAFDGVVSIGVLEHVRETGGSEAASLREIRRVLRPGGAFICFHLPNELSWIELALRAAGRWSHAYRASGRTIHAWAAEAGLTVEALGRYGALPRNLWWSQRLRAVGNSPRFARAYDAADRVLGVLLAPICQNYWFVARRP